MRSKGRRVPKNSSLEVPRPIPLPDLAWATLVLVAVQESLTPDLRHLSWKDHPHPLGGHCYVASEAIWHLLGGKASGWQSFVARVPVVGNVYTTHWWLEHPLGFRLDATAAQFDRPVPYEIGRRCGFLTRLSSKRARIAIERASRILQGSNDPAAEWKQEATG